MSSREMFANLGYIQVDNITKEDIPRKSWGRELDRFEIVYKNGDNLILFYKKIYNYNNLFNSKLW